MVREVSGIGEERSEVLSAASIAPKETVLSPVRKTFALPSPRVSLDNEGRKERITRWNTRHLCLRLRSDAAAAASATVLIAPVITMIDRGIIENASGRDTLMGSISACAKRMMLRPHQFIFSKPFGLIFMLYFGTYVTANSLDTVSSTIDNKSSQTVTSGPAKFIATTSANMSLCLYKDSCFARMFGPPHTIPRPVPPASFALFALRDSLTIFASFNLPPIIAPLLPVTEGLEKSMSRASVAQFVAPAAVQLLSTPLHLLGLDFYNRGDKSLQWSLRWSKIRENYFTSSLARMCRVVPAFSVGAVVNTRVRRNLLGSVEER